MARLTKTYLRKNDGTVLDKSDYTYNVGNQRAKVTRTDASTVDYTYDPIGQLTSGDSSAYGEDRGYRYDAAWNLVNRTNSTIPEDFSVNGKNELLAAMGTNCTYDANGNLTTNGVWSFVFDDENRLVQIINTNAGHEVRIDLTYDGLGRLRIREFYNTEGAPAPRLELDSNPGGYITWYLAGQSYYVYDGMCVIKEQSPISGETFSYTRGTDLRGSLQGAGGIGGLLARSYKDYNWETTRHDYYHADGNGNITYLVDSNQGLAASYRYDPFGNIISQSGDLADANVHRFSSKAFDPLSGLYYYGNRWYSPQLQRWLTRDPLFETGGVNLYSHALNNPLMWIDPFGETIYTRETVEAGINPNSDPIISQQLDLGCNGLTMVYQQSGCPNRNVTTSPEGARNTKCFLTESEARNFRCPPNKTAFIFAKQGRWDAAPNPASDGSVPNNSIKSKHFNYVTCLPGGKWKYAWMDHGKDKEYGPQHVQCENTPPPPNSSYPNEIWCVTCKCP